jgi:hypothetical protein
VNLLQEVSRRDLVQLLGERGLMRVVIVGAGYVREQARLIRNRFGDLRMGVAKRRNSDAGVEIEERVAVHVFYDGAVAAFHHQRVAARVTGRDIPGVAFEYGFCFRSGQGSPDLGQLEFKKSLHGASFHEWILERK